MLLGFCVSSGFMESNIRIAWVVSILNHIVVRNGKGSKDRVTILPDAIRQRPNNQIDYVGSLHKVDLDNDCGVVYMPNALSRKHPQAASSIGWQYCFPAKNTSIDPRSSLERRYPILAQSVQRRVNLPFWIAALRNKRAVIPFGTVSLPVY